MQKILLAQAKEGMVLGREIETPEGRILCGKGTELTESLLSRLARMDIVSVTVEGHPVAEPGRKTLAEEMADIEGRFCRVNKIAPLLYIKNRLLQRLILSRQDPEGSDPSATGSQAAEQSEDGSR